MRQQIVYRELTRYKYQLLEPASYATDITGFEVETSFVSLGFTGVLYCSRWYAWDGASGPARDTKSFMRASLFHDALYQLMSSGHLPTAYRKRADEIMRRIAREDGMGKFRAWYTYHAVRIFGGQHLGRYQGGDG